MAEPARSQRALRRRARRRRSAAVAAGVALAASGTAVGVAVTTNGGTGRRLATVATSSVTQTVDSSGVITSSLKLTPGFAVAGTVKSVEVTVGQSVRKGQTLAELDSTALQAAIDAADATLATGQERLQADETGQTTSGQTGTSAASSSNGSTTSGTFTSAYVIQAPTAPTAGSSTSALIAQIKAAQAAVVATQQHLDTGQAAVDAAQKTVDTDVSQNTARSAAQQSMCATSPDPSPTASSAPPSPPADCAAAMADYEASAATLATDMTTVDTAITAQDRYTTEQQQAIAKLGVLLGQLKSVSTGTGSTGSGQPGGSPSAPAGGSGQSSTGRSGSAPGSTPAGGSASGGSGQTGQISQTGQSVQPASAAQIAADQAAIDAARAQVAAAEQNRAAATLKSPTAGKVAAVGLAAGESSSGRTITIVGTGVQGVDVTVPLAQVDLVKAGQRVTVSADGRTSVLHGTVESVGLMSSSSGSSTTFPVTVELAAGSPQLYDGTGAGVVITTGTATDVVTVPNSAIHVGRNGTHTVTVARGSSTSTVTVTLGVVGDDVTQVKSGITAGQQVVLADLGQQLPTSTSSTTVNFRLGQFGGAGGGRVGG